MMHQCGVPVYVVCVCIHVCDSLTLFVLFDAGGVKNKYDFQNLIRRTVFRESKRVFEDMPSAGRLYLTVHNYEQPLIPPQKLHFEPTVSSDCPSRVEVLLRSWKVLFWDIESLHGIQVKCSLCDSNMTATGWSKGLRERGVGEEQLRFILHADGSCTVLFEVVRKCDVCSWTQHDGDGDVLEKLPPYIKNMLPYESFHNMIGSEQPLDASDNEKNRSSGAHEKIRRRRALILGRSVTELMEHIVPNGNSWEMIRAWLEKAFSKKFDDASEIWHSMRTMLCMIHNEDEDACVIHKEDWGCSEGDFDNFAQVSSGSLRRALLDTVIPPPSLFHEGYQLKVEKLSPLINLAAHNRQDSCVTEKVVDVHVALDGNRTMCKKACPRGKGLKYWLAAVDGCVHSVLSHDFVPDEGKGSLVKVISMVPEACRIVSISLDNIQSTQEGTGEKETAIIAACLGRPAQQGLVPRIFQDYWHAVKVPLSLFPQNHSSYEDFKQLLLSVGRKLDVGILRVVVEAFLDEGRRKSMKGFFYAGEGDARKGSKTFFKNMTDQQVSAYDDSVITV